MPSSQFKMIQDYWFSNDNFRKVTGKEPGVRREERELGVKSEGSEIQSLLASGFILLFYNCLVKNLTRLLIKPIRCLSVCFLVCFFPLARPKRLNRLRKSFDGRFPLENRKKRFQYWVFFTTFIL